MESLKSIQYQNRAVNFSFHNGALSLMRDLGYEIDYNKNPLEGLEGKMDVFLADFLLCSAKFYSRKDPDFAYDINDAYDWMDILGGFQPVIEILTNAMMGKIKIPEGVVIPNEKLKSAKK